MRTINNEKILFYEWSNINCLPLTFVDHNQFLDFCNKSNITVTKKNYNFIIGNQTVYATCKKSRGELILSGDQRNFRKNFSKHRNDQ